MRDISIKDIVASGGSVGNWQPFPTGSLTSGFVDYSGLDGYTQPLSYRVLDNKIVFLRGIVGRVFVASGTVGLTIPTLIRSNRRMHFSIPLSVIAFNATNTTPNFNATEVIEFRPDGTVDFRRSGSTTFYYCLDGISYGLAL